MERRVANLAYGRSGRWAGICAPIPIRSRDLPARSRCRGRVLAAARRPVGLRSPEFVVGPYQTSLGAGEVLTSVRIPQLPRGAAVAHAKFAFYERPTATVACLARVEEGEVGSAGCGWITARPACSSGGRGAHRSPVDEIGDAPRKRRRAAEAAAPWTMRPAPPSTRRSSCACSSSGPSGSGRMIDRQDVLAAIARRTNAIQETMNFVHEHPSSVTRSEEARAPLRHPGCGWPEVERG